MLLPPSDALRFLRAYKDLLTNSAGRPLNTLAAFQKARDAFFTGPRRHTPPTREPDMREALEHASFGEFTVARHRSRYSEMCGADDRIYHVVGITTELEKLVAPWSIVRTAVMPFRGAWVCDGLLVGLGLRIGPGLKREILAKLRHGLPPAPLPAARPEDAQGEPVRFTPRQGQYLALIQAYTKLNGRAPAEADIQRHFGVTAPSVHQMILTLERLRLIRRIPGASRSITLLVPEHQLRGLL